MTKREEWLDVESLIMAVSNIEALSIDHFQVFTWPVMICWVIFKPFWESGLQILLGSFLESNQLMDSSLTGSLPLGFLKPNNTSAKAFPASWPWYQPCIIAGTASAQGIVTGEPDWLTTIVLGFAFNTSAINRS